MHRISNGIAKKVLRDAYKLSWAHLLIGFVAEDSMHDHGYIYHTRLIIMWGNH